MMTSHSSESKFTASAQFTIFHNEFEDNTFEIIAITPGAIELMIYEQLPT